jgi:hypothetical protein
LGNILGRADILGIQIRQGRHIRKTSTRQTNVAGQTYQAEILGRHIDQTYIGQTYIMQTYWSDIYLADINWAVILGRVDILGRPVGQTYWTNIYWADKVGRRDIGRQICNGTMGKLQIFILLLSKRSNGIKWMLTNSN